MQSVFSSLVLFMKNFIDTVNGFQFSIAGINVGVFDILFGFLVLSMVVTVFWKGAKG